MRFSIGRMLTEGKTYLWDSQGQLLDDIVCVHVSIYDNGFQQNSTWSTDNQGSFSAVRSHCSEWRPSTAKNNEAMRGIQGLKAIVHLECHLSHPKSELIFLL